MNPATVPAELNSRQSQPNAENPDNLNSNLLTSESDSREERKRQTLVALGIGGIGLLSILLVLFGYLRLNHATRGFYSRRLQMGAMVIVILVLLACFGLISMAT